MNELQRIAFVQAQVACAMAEIAGMQATNMLHPGQPVFKYDDFMAIQDKYLIGHNAVITYFQGG